MNNIDDKEESTVTIRAVSHDEEGRKQVEKTEVNIHKIDTLKYIEKKLADNGLVRMERHSADGIPLARGPPKSGHGGKYTWEGPMDEAEAELKLAPPAIDEKDPNYVDEEAEERLVEGGLVMGEVEVAKDGVGVARVELDPRLQGYIN
ncbi:uncharacterized protein LOC132315031 [Cornus florida]|uniref:uncharacterized protein LOC132315031 n=1 Tax=Cornus florida TaxID=4283 RepID=UPI00289B1C64|nr:uncharacterized protein LOC132315031 [Cornus florida]